MESKKTKRTGDTTNIILEKLLEAIVNDSFVPGEPIRMSQVAKDLGVYISRSGKRYVAPLP